MSDEQKPVETVQVVGDETTGHECQSAGEIENFHFNVIGVLQDAAKRFKEKTGKDAKYFYAPEALMYLLDRAVKVRSANLGQPLPPHLGVVNLCGLDLIVVSGTCITVTAEPLHDTSNTPPVIVPADTPETLQ